MTERRYRTPPATLRSYLAIMRAMGYRGTAKAIEETIEDAVMLREAWLDLWIRFGSKDDEKAKRLEKATAYLEESDENG